MEEIKPELPRAPRIQAIPNVDAVPDALQPSQPAPRATRRRGRPPRALGKTIFPNDKLTSDEIAFLRAWLQGVALPQAARHYLPSDVHNDGRAAPAYLRQLLERLRAAAGRLTDPARALAYVDEIVELKDAAGQRPALQQAVPVAATPLAPPAPALPTLEEFAARFPEDMYSEGELLELYEEEFCAEQLVPPAADALTPAAPGSSPAMQDPVQRPMPLQSAAGPTVAFTATRLEMLDWLAPRVAIQPSSDGLLTVWLGEATGDLMRKRLGLTTLEHLAAWINVTGTRWYDRVPNMGRLRAQRLLRWIVDHEDDIGVRLRERVSAGVRRAAAVNPLATTQSILAPSQPDKTHTRAALVPGHVQTPAQLYALVPLDQLLWPDDLAGANGLLRRHGPNTYGALNDRQALKGWIARAVEGQSPASRTVALRAAEKFVLWAVLERRQALSSMAGQDLADFREFLYDPPDSWCTKERVMRFAQEWRPMRGPLQAVAVTQVIGVIKRMYVAWRESGYLQANPAHGLSARRARWPLEVAQQKTAAPTPLAMNVKRSFVEEDLQAMQRTLAEMPDGPARRRLRAILSLFVESGLRRSEVDHLMLGTPTPVRLKNELSGVLQITVVGKGEKPREIPIKAETIAALEAHYNDRLALVASGKLPAAYGDIPRERTPVLSIVQLVRDPGEKNGKVQPALAGPGFSPADAPRGRNPDGRLDGSSIYTILKAFFKKVGQRTDLVQGQADFDRASTHWLRHTFAHRVLATGQAELPTVQALMGHANINTTGIYLEADMADRVRAISAVKSVF